MNRGNGKMFKRSLIFVIVLVISVSVAVPVQSASSPQGGGLDQVFYLPVIAKAPTTLCRFGITALPKNSTYNADLVQLKIGGFIDWSGSPSRSLPLDVTYLRVISVKDPPSPEVYNIADAAASAAANAAAHPGSYWQVGNEPDTQYCNADGSCQDNVYADQYADRFYALATAIRAADPNAKIGFGSIVQPTPIRLYYLNLAWERLKVKAGSAAAAGALIDFWSIHSFILNEVQGQWGTGVPKGYQASWGAPFYIDPDHYSYTYNATIFADRVRSMRQWMKDRGQQTKALWITEYGSLFPSETISNLVTVSQQNTASFMVATFNFMLNTQDASLGMPADGNRLVQRWFWYSLNEDLTTYGGSLYDPRNGALTLVGQTFKNYTAPLPVASDCLPR